MKKLIAIVLAAALLFSFCGCKEEKKETAEEKKYREYTDDFGKTFTIPEKITKIAVTGPISQGFIIPLASDILVAKAEVIPESAEKYYPDNLKQLEILGQIYGNKAVFDKEKLLSLAPDIVIDIGEAKKTAKEDFENLTNTLGIPFIHIEGSTLDAAQIYEKLGVFLGREEKAKEYTDFINKELEQINETVNKAKENNDEKSFVYSLSDNGLYIMAKDAFHGKALNLVGINAAALESFSSSGNGTEVSLEQIYSWDPEYLVLMSHSLFNQIKTDESWSGLFAVENGNCLKVPNQPICWLASQGTYLYIHGLSWLTSELYPQYYSYDLESDTKDFFRIFYNYELSSEEYSKITE